MTGTITQPTALTKRRFKSTAWASVSERLVLVGLGSCAVATLLITVGILVMLVTQSWHFFASEYVEFGEFFSGGRWTALQAKEIEDARFGIWPLLSGTLRVTVIAMVIALPLGLMTAIYLSEFASRRVRSLLKPTLEVIAGIPTVVLGFFAILVISPGLQWISGGSFDTFNATSAGIAVGILCLPMVCSLSEDALQAVPTSLREGAYGLGCTPFETATKVVVPAALSGIVSAFLLAFSRAIGETMVVALAAGTRATATLDPREQSQTMTGFIVEMIKSESEFGTVQYYSLYGVAMALFVITFAMTVVGQMVRRRYRESYQ
ncbi:phosphate ABC transporter permease subunit PstC [Roseimaritima sediminicola]|uniref:phosphate ABC transporter permease subunit PstC n=1 Tax=Roseimaritima sediminicola TaxID=2662066 RepID=UPI001EEF7079|nr:phosphate ABC transporter permease subunit PstC [Roseimaritima sediminicola]